MEFESFKSIALSFPETNMEIHFNKISFRISKKIFATYDPDTNQTVVKLGIFQQDEFCEKYPEVLEPVPNKWGKKGWTNFDITNADNSFVFEIVKAAFLDRAPKSISKNYQRNTETS
ncbi:MAG: MmcQ/YjbR family DNA-binding protein [Saprospiraceae bacterium]|nr:MmcQ/YjbR family DNA-binding protein [Saprospiraceae bacterium]